MGVATGCSCKEVYRFPHTTIPTPLVSFLIELVDSISRDERDAP